MSVYTLTSPGHKIEARNRRLKPGSTNDHAEMEASYHQLHSRHMPRKCERCATLRHKISMITTTSNESSEGLCRRCSELNDVSHGAVKHAVLTYQRRRLSAILEEPRVQSQMKE